MHPLIAKVKVGDVLHGTRNLRNYLRTVSLKHAIACISQEEFTNGPAKIYTPSKKDDFVVAVNSWGRFGVWCGRENVMLLWINPRDASNVPLRMSPSLFANWFVRTPRRRPGLSEWPLPAYNMWVLFQLNAAAVMPPIFNLEESAFYLATSLGLYANREKMREAAQEAIQQGLTRTKVANSKPERFPVAGPRLADIVHMERSIRQSLADLRTRKKVAKSGLNFDLNNYI